MSDFNERDYDTLNRIRPKTNGGKGMNRVKIKQCRECWERNQSLKTPVVLHLFAAVEIAERLIDENDKLEMENRELRDNETEIHSLKSQIEKLERDAAAQNEVLEAYSKAANKFIGKCNARKAKSTETYNELMACNALHAALSTNSGKAQEMREALTEVLTHYWMTGRNQGLRFK